MHTAVHERQPVALDLPPLPRDALPESPVVIVIAGAAVKADAISIHLDRSPCSVPDMTGTT